MSTITYYTTDYDKLRPYVTKHNRHHYVCIPGDTKIKIIKKNNFGSEEKILTIDLHDFVKFDRFLLEKNIKCDFGEDDWYYIGVFIEENYTEAIDYLVETEFHLVNDQTEEDIFIFFIEACEFACADIIMAFIGYINWKEVYNDIYLSRTFGKRDEDIISLILNNIPSKFIDYHSCASEAILMGRLYNLLLLEEKYQISFIQHLDEAIATGHIEIMEHMISKGADLQLFIDTNTDDLIICAESGHMEMFEYILDKVVFSQEQLNRLLQASYNCNGEFIDLLIDAGADFVEYGEGLYQNTMDRGNTQLAAYLHKNYL